MVLMYHEIGPRESTWRRTPENFAKDLERLYDSGYRPIRLRDVVKGDISTPRGMAPVVITFDDGTAGQFRFIKSKDGKDIPAPDSAVGILKSFSDRHPDFVPHATFFLHGSRPFGQKENLVEKLHYLIENEMDIGNHTTQHQNLGSSRYQNAAEIQRIVGKQAQFLKSKLTHYPDYPVDLLALCYGRRPKSPWLNRLLSRGAYKNVPYENIAVMNVGAGPSYSPFDNRFTPLAMPRIRASETNTYGVGIFDWMAYFNAHPEERFVSDGDPETVTLPSRFENHLRPPTPEGRIRKQIIGE